MHATSASGSTLVTTSSPALRASALWKRRRAPQALPLCTSTAAEATTIAAHAHLIGSPRPGRTQKRTPNALRR